MSYMISDCTSEKSFGRRVEIDVLYNNPNVKGFIFFGSNMRFYNICGKHVHGFH